jgi:MFS-type transporter involved in bile tolerance (Atg22 family)
VQRGVLAAATQPDQLRTNVVLSVVSALSTTAAAVLAMILIQRIDELQTRRPWVPWWAAGQPQSGFQPPAR